jgi:hypothetical protein
MSAQVMCNCCGRDATLIFTEGLPTPDSSHSGIRIIQTVECENCGKREQLTAFVKR